MKDNNKDRMLLGASIGGFALLSVSFMLMPAEKLGVLPGILFWVGLILGVVPQFILEAHRKALFARYGVKRETMQKVRNGLLSFASNQVAAIADGFLIGSSVAMVLAFILTKSTGYICYVTLSLLIFSFCMHSILNGRIYIFVRNQDKIRQVLEQKKANSVKKREGK